MDFKCNGEFLVTFKREGVPVKIVRVHNIITTVGRELIGDMLRDVDGYDTGLTYCALGTTTSEPLTSQTALAAEVTRKIVSNNDRTGTVVTWTTQFYAEEATYDIKEIAMFGHDATGDVDTGVMFDRATVDFNNGSALYDITFDYRLTLS